MTIGLLVAIGVVYAMEEIAGGPSNPAVTVAFGANFGPLVRAGDLWRLVASVFLHGNLLHVALNGWALYVLGRNLEAFYGAWRFLALFLLPGVAGAVASAALSSGFSVGASGGIFGLFGASIVFAFRFRALLPVRVVRVMGTALLPWLGLNLALGALVPVIDMAAHAGGLACGALLALVLVPDTIREMRGLAPPPPRMLASLCVMLLLTGVAGGGRSVFALRGPDGPVLDPRVVAAVDEMDRAAAREAVDDALAKDPSDPEALRVRGDLRAAAGEWEGAIRDYRTVIERLPGDALARNNLAWFLLEEAPARLRDPAEALRLAESAAALDPASAYVTGTLGAARLRNGDAAAAVPLLARAVAASRPAADVATDRFLLAIAYARLGRPDEARAAVRQAVREDPGNQFRAEAESSLAASEAPETQSAPSP